MKAILIIVFGLFLMFFAAMCGCECNPKISPLSPEQTIGVTTSGGDTYNIQLSGSGLYLAVAVVAVLMLVLATLWLRSRGKARKLERQFGNGKSAIDNG